MTGLYASRVAARLRRELHADVDMVHGRYGEFKVLVDGDTIINGGGAAFLAHAGKAGARTLINASPEPFSNVVVSSAEDIGTGSLLALAIASPLAAAAIALSLVLASLWLVHSARRALRRFLFPRPHATADRSKGGHELTGD